MRHGRRGMQTKKTSITTEKPTSGGLHQIVPECANFHDDSRSCPAFGSVMLNDDVITDVKGWKWACCAVVMDCTKFFGAECAFFENSGILLPFRRKRTTMSRD
jgi:hypothetical protein